MTNLLGKSSLPVELYSKKPNRFIIIAHRGASAYYPENTLSSFEAAITMDADMIELDVTLTNDGVPVVIHDETLDRTTNGKGKVSDYSLEELKRLDAGFWFHPKFKDEAIPTLEEVLNHTSGKVALNIEIKPEAVSDHELGGIEEKCLHLVKKYNMQRHVIFSSFYYKALSHLRRLDKTLATGVLFESRQAAGRLPSQLTKEYQAQAFHCNFRKLNSKWLEDAKAHQIPVLVYTVNSVPKMKSLIEKGVTGIFTDRPDKIKDLVEKMWEIN